jgi:hypothetical protein
MADNQETKSELTEGFVALINSTIEGETGEWDSSTDEGKEGFADMRELLYRVAELSGIQIPEERIKEI